MEDLKPKDYILIDTGEIAQCMNVKQDYVSTDLGLVDLKAIKDYNPSILKLLQPGDLVNGFPISKNPQGIFTLGNQPLSSIEIKVVMTRHFYETKGYHLSGTSTKEQWKTIKDFPRYEVSTLGKVRLRDNLRYISVLNDREQMSVRLQHKDGRRLRRSIAVLVLETFDSLSDGRLPKYKNGDNQDCRLSNLEWETREEQIRRVIPKQVVPHKRYKYNNLVGYIQNKPVIYAANSGELRKLLYYNSPDFAKLSLNHLSRSIRTGVPYKGILIKEVSNEKYKVLSQEIDNSQFNSYYKEFCQNRPQQKTKRQPKPEPQITKSIFTQPKSHTRLDDLTDDDFERDLEQEKREHFKQELLKRLNGG